MWRPALVLCLVLPVLPARGATGTRARGQNGERPSMVALPGGSYRAVTANVSEPTRSVPPFRMDRTPVTNEAFLAFVRSNPVWQRDRVSRLVADERYLVQWSGPAALGPGAPPQAPVVGVSWFAAGAYCAARGARLPSEAEWEMAAAASPRDRDGRRDPAWRQTVLDWYARPNPPRLPDVGRNPANYWGLQDLHGLVWEWVSDFGASMLVGKDARLCGGAAQGALDPLDYPAFLRTAFRSSLEGRMTTTNLGFRCAEDGSDRRSPPATTEPRESPTSPTTSGSIYRLGLRVRDADGVIRGLDDLRGHPVLASMFFASCTSVCPLLISAIKRIEAAAPTSLRKDLRIVLVSFDPARDTPAVLVDVGRRHDVDPRRWRITVAPDAASARAMAAVLGIRYRAAAEGTIAHTTAITVVDRQGEVRGRAEDPAAVGAILARLASQEPTAAR